MIRKNKNITNRSTGRRTVPQHLTADSLTTQPTISIDYVIPRAPAQSDLEAVKRSRKRRRVTSNAPSYDLGNLNLARLSLATGASSTVASSEAHTPYDSTRAPSPPDLDFNDGGDADPANPTRPKLSISRVTELDMQVLLERLDEAALDQTADGKEKNQSKRQGKSSNNLLKEWNDIHLESYLDVLFELDSLSSSVCISCGATFQASIDLDTADRPLTSEEGGYALAFKCLDCPVPHAVCKGCCLAAHKFLPCHRLASWTDCHWKRTSLNDLGYVLYLGHQGCSCEFSVSTAQGAAASKVVQMTIGDVTGFSTVRVGFCTHKDAGPQYLQLLASGIMPCTDAYPKSGFTLTLLKLHDLLLYVAKVSTSRINQVLSKMTDAAFPHLTPNRYRELMLCSRKYGHLLDLKRSGAAHIPNKDSQGVRDLSNRCPACPRPGWNYEPDDVIDVERPYFRSYYCLDGNYRNPRKSKAYDANDLACSDGRKYFVQQTDYLAWIHSPASDPPSKRKKPACDHHKAASGIFKNWQGLDVTGIGAITCARHSVFADGGVINFYQGELHKYGDYAFSSVMAQQADEGQELFGLIYDIYCHWSVHFLPRLRQVPLGIRVSEDILKRLIGAIGKMHLAGHEEECWIRFSLNYLQYSGRIDREGCERTWSHLNETAGSTSEKGPGARIDHMNHVMGFWNFDKLVGMASFLVKKFIDAKKQLVEQDLDFEEYHASIDSELTSEWVGLSTDPVKQNGNWTSVYKVSRLAKPMHLGEASIEDPQTELSEQPKSFEEECTKWILEGFQIETTRERLALLVLESKKNPGPSKDAEINQQRSRLLQQIVSHEEKKPQVMVALNEPDAPAFLSSSGRKPLATGSDDPENRRLLLPLSFLANTLELYGLSHVAKLEQNLRIPAAHKALGDLRLELGRKAHFARFKKKNLRGEGLTTRAQNTLRRYGQRISFAAWQYNYSRHALYALGWGSQPGHREFRSLEQSDLVMLSSYMEDDRMTLGQGYRKIPWIWKNYASQDEADAAEDKAEGEEWIVEAQRGEWFQAKARTERWREECILLKREMVMIQTDFHQHECVWRQRQRNFANVKMASAAGRAAYAAKQATMWQQLRCRASSQCNVHLEDPIVSIQWCEMAMASLALG